MTQDLIGEIIIDALEHMPGPRADGFPTTLALNGIMIDLGAPLENLHQFIFQQLSPIFSCCETGTLAEWLRRGPAIVRYLDSVRPWDIPA